MDLARLKLDTSNVIDILDYLRKYCELSEDNPLIVDIENYKQYIRVKTRMRRRKINSKLVKIEHKHLMMLGLGKTLPISVLTREDIVNGTILLVRDCAGNLAPYQNPIEKEIIKQKKLGGIKND